MPFPKNLIFATSLLRDPVEIVLGMFFWWRAGGPEERHVLRTGVLGRRIAISAHSRIMTPYRRVTPFTSRRRASPLDPQARFVRLQGERACAIELLPNETDVAVTTIPFALNRDFQRTSHGHQRDVEDG
jgi:hypothetical protein